MKSNLFEEEENDEDLLFSRAHQDNNLDVCIEINLISDFSQFQVEDLTPTPGSPINRYALRDKRQRNSIVSNGVTPKLNDESFSQSPPSSPRSTRHNNEVNIF